MVAHTRNPNILEAETEVSSNKASLGYIVRPVKTNKQANKNHRIQYKSKAEVYLSPANLPWCRL